MSKHLQRDMDLVHREVLSLSATVEEMIDKAAQALTEQSADLSEKVMAMDRGVDEREVRIEDECLKILALHQPVAGDLRRIATVLKANNDLERIGDLAVNIVQRARDACVNIRISRCPSGCRGWWPWQWAWSAGT